MGRYCSWNSSNVAPTRALLAQEKIWAHAVKSAQQCKARSHVIVHGIVPDVPSGRDGVTIGGCRTFSLILRTNSVPVSLSFVCFPINGDVRVGGQALAQTSVKIICFRALPTLIVRKPHATTPFRTTGLAGQSWPNKLSIGRPTLLTLPSIVQRQAPLFTDQVNVHLTARCEKTNLVMAWVWGCGDASLEIILSA